MTILARLTRQVQLHEYVMGCVGLILVGWSVFWGWLPVFSTVAAWVVSGAVIYFVQRAVLGGNRSPATWASLAVNTILILFTLTLFHHQGQDLAGEYDARTYHQIASAVAQSFRAGEWYTQPVWLDNHLGYYYWLGLLYTVFGTNLLVAKLFNAVFLALTVLFAQSLAEEISGDRAVGERTAWCVTAFTGLWLNTMFLLKDNVIVFMITFAFWLLWKNAKARPNGLLSRWEILLAGVVAVLVPFRSHLAILVWIAYLALSVAPILKERQFSRLAGVIVVSLALGITLGGLTPHGIFGWKLLFNQVDVLQSDSGSQPATTNSPQLWQVFTREALQPRFWAGTTVGVVRSVLMPYGWMIPGLTTASWTWDVLSYPGMYLWYALLPALVLALWRALRRLDLYALSVFGLAAAVVFVYSFTWMGSTRHRDQIVPLLIVMATVGVKHDFGLHWIYPVVWGLLLVGSTVQAGFSPAVSVLLGSGGFLIWLTIRKSRNGSSLPGDGMRG